MDFEITWEELSFYNDCWLIFCKVESNFEDLDKDSTQYYICEECYVSSSLVTASYQDLIGFAEEITEVRVL